MAASAPRIFVSFTVSNAGGTSSPTTYQLHRSEGLSVAENPIEDMVEDGQTIQHGFNYEVSLDCYDLAVLSDARVQYGATIPSTEARLVFNPVSGGVTETHDNVKLSGTRVFDDQQRPFARLKYTRTSANSAITLS
jgi:hypothetical protein